MSDASMNETGNNEDTMSNHNDSGPGQHPDEAAAAAAAWEAVADVDGWMTRGQSDLLVHAARQCPRGGRIVEIGSFQGRSTVVLALSAPPTVEIIAIDPHAGTDRGPNEIDGYDDEAAGDYDAFHRNLADAGVADRVRHLRMFSNDALDEVAGPFDVVYIDGAHRYRPALNDITAWGSRVAPGGILLIHDAFSSVGVTGAIARALMWNGEMTYVRRSRSLVMYRRTASPRVRNAVNQVAQMPWFARNVALKAFLTLGGGGLLRRAGRAVPEWPY